MFALESIFFCILFASMFNLFWRIVLVEVDQDNTGL